MSDDEDLSFQLALQMSIEESDPNLYHSWTQHDDNEDENVKEVQGKKLL